MTPEQMQIKIAERAANRAPCNWKPNEEGQWATTCGEMFEFTNDGPTENGFKHCPYCGKPLTEPKL